MNRSNTRASRTRLAIALTIAGSDSGGGAGIQADLKTFAALGVHGTSAVTCLTAQNPEGVFGIQPTTPRMVRNQLEAIVSILPPTAAKTGMLYSASIIRVVLQVLQDHPKLKLVVDPVMVATSGAKLLKPEAIRILCDQLIPRALVVTPNLDEAEILTGRKLKSLDAVREAARQIHATHGCAVLLKGGHLADRTHAIDILFDGRTETQLEAPYARGVTTHGTGCTYSAAIAAELAKGSPLLEAVETAKWFITQAIHTSQRIGRHTVLNTIQPPDVEG
jgi:hydroxymethylpyrimidine/phosphomethylpyrimidine kinase